MMFIVGQISGSCIEVDYVWLARKQLATYIKKFLSTRHVDSTLISNILCCQEINLTSQKFLLSQMSPFECINSPTLINLKYTRYQHVLSKLDLQDFFSIDEIYFLIQQFDEAIIPKGQVFMEKGELVDSLYIVLHGNLHILENVSTFDPEQVAEQMEEKASQLFATQSLTMTKTNHSKKSLKSQMQQMVEIV